MAEESHFLGIFQTAQREKIPLEVSIELTHHCNFRCRHCYIPDFQAPDQLSTDRVLKLLDELVEMGTLYLTFTGGEVFLRQDWREIFRAARKRGFQITILSNGSLIDEEIADEIAALDALVEISYYAAEVSTFEETTRRDGSFEATTRAVRRLRQRQVQLQLKMPMMHLNRKERDRVQAFAEELVLVPVGAIGSRARTMTVRVFSRKDIGGLKSIHVDGESHTSIALLRVILAEVYGSYPDLYPLERNALGEIPKDVEAALLIGDKVVTEEPPAEDFPEQLDLGEAWRKLTGLPFVFAMWMTRSGIFLGELPELLRTQLEENLSRIEEYLPGWAAEHGWPLPEAREYLVDLLDYSAGPVQIEAIELFWKKCRQHEVISNLREMRLIA